MKKIFVAIAALLVGALLVSAVSASDCYGREREFVNGDVVFFDQKVVVTNESYLFSFMPTETFEHCTVTITSSNDVKIVTEDGKQIRSTNGFRFEFGTTAFFWGNAWNNIPRSGENPEFEDFDTKNLITIAKSALEYLTNNYKTNQKSLKPFINNYGITVTDASGNEFTLESAGDIVITGENKARGDVSGTVTGYGYVAIFTIKYGNSTEKYGTVVFENGMKGSNGAYIITSNGSRISVFDDN